MSGYLDGMHVDIVGGDRMMMLVSGQRDDGILDVLGFSVSTGERCRRSCAHGIVSHENHSE